MELFVDAISLTVVLFAVSGVKNVFNIAITVFFAASGIDNAFNIAITVWGLAPAFLPIISTWLCEANAILSIRLAARDGLTVDLVDVMLRVGVYIDGNGIGLIDDLFVDKIGLTGVSFSVSEFNNAFDIFVAELSEIGL